MTNSHIIFLKGKDKTHEIAHCELKDNKILVQFKSSPKVFTYTKPNFSIFPKARDSKVFCYLQTLAYHIKSDENTIALLSKEYSKITHIPDSCVLFEYLNPTPPISTTAPSTQSQHPPILVPFGLNLSQYQALQNALSHKISVIEGPPGTGKTQTILNLIANLLYRAKTIAVLSNNNAATQNIYEKLHKHNLTHLCAFLGKKENKQSFIANQKSKYQDNIKNLATQDLESKNIEQTIQESHQKLKEIFKLQNSIATTKRELEALELEYKYFKNQECKVESNLESTLESNLESSPMKIPKIRTLFAKPTPHTILRLKIILEEHKQERLSLWLKLKGVYYYGMGDFRFYNSMEFAVCKFFSSVGSESPLRSATRSFRPLL